MMISTMLLRLLSLLTLICVQCATAAAPAVVMAAKPLVYCSDASPEGFDPSLWDSASTGNVTAQMFQGLLAVDRASGTLRPELATAWAVSPDAKTFTFTLRRGVAFHSTPYFSPTRTFNADDVLFTFARMTDAQHPFHLAFPATYVYAESLGLAKMIAGVDRVDEHTVRFRLSAPNVTFLNYLAMSFSGMHSAEYAAQLMKQGRASAINNEPVGTGPYQFKRYRKDDVLRLVPHAGYWKGAQDRVSQLIFAISREAPVRVQKMAAGECHITAPLRDIDLPALNGRSEVVVLQKQALNISYLAFNLKKPLLQNRAVREALDIAIDRNAIFKVLFPRGDAQQAVSAFPPAVPGFNTDLKNEFNPARAKQLLAEAGHADGFVIELWALPVARPTNPNGMLMAQLIQQDWAKIGVRATIKTYEWGEYLKRANKGEHDVYMSGWSSDLADADEFLTPNLSCANSKDGIKFCNAEFDRLLDQARGSADPEQRNALYKQAQTIFKRERPWMPMAHSSIYIPVRRDVKGFVMAANGSVDFEGVWRP
jgi:ABC-type transport system substrate-binding protein